MGFWTGAILGSVAGAAYALWTTPQSGEDLRESLLTVAEERVASFGGMEVWTPDEESAPATPPTPAPTPEPS